MTDIHELETLGLDHVALDVYRALLEHPDADDSALADSLRLEPDALRETKQRLRNLQLLVPTWAMPGREHAVQPSAGLSALLHRRRAELTQQQEALHRTEAAASVLAAQLTEHLIPRDGTEVEILRGRARANSRLAELGESVEESVWSLNPVQFADTAVTEEMQTSPDRHALDRGVKMRIIYLASMMTRRAAIDNCAWYRERGSEVRMLPTLPMRLAIFDRRLVVMPLDHEDHDAGALIHRGQSVVKLAIEFFQSCWSKASDVFEVKDAMEPDTLTPQEAELIRLLTDGATDEQVARRFGVSIRTVRRIAAELSMRTGARSRFELGVRAAQLGWIT